MTIRIHFDVQHGSWRTPGRRRGELQMVKTGMTLLFVIAWVLSATTAAAQTAQSLGAPAGDAARGERVYMEQLCYTCHGTVGQGGERGAGPKIYPNPFPYQAWVTQIRKPR